MHTSAAELFEMLRPVVEQRPDAVIVLQFAPTWRSEPWQADGEIDVELCESDEETAVLYVTGVAAELVQPQWALVDEPQLGD